MSNFMSLSKEKLKAADIAVDVIDFIETKVYEVIQNNEAKEKFIDKVIELINSHYKNDFEIVTNNVESKSWNEIVNSDFLEL